MGLPEVTYLQAVKPLYGIPESVIHWYLTYISHHLDFLGMRSSLSDPCVLLWRSVEGPCRLIMLQIEVTLGVGTTDFLRDEYKDSKYLRINTRM